MFTKSQTLSLCSAVLIILFCIPTLIQAQVDDTKITPRLKNIFTVDDGPDDVFIRTTYALDEPRFYCMDIPNNDENPEGIEMWLHTCKEGMTHRDTMFSFSQSKMGTLYMTDYDLCLEADTLTTGSTLKLAACDGNTNQNWDLADNLIRAVADSTLCITVSATLGELTRGGESFPTRYKSRPLNIEACNESIVDRQQWALTSPRQDLQAPILPDGSLADWRDFEEVLERGFQDTSR